MGVAGGCILGGGLFSLHTTRRNAKHRRRLRLDGVRTTGRVTSKHMERRKRGNGYHWVYYVNVRFECPVNRGSVEMQTAEKLFDISMADHDRTAVGTSVEMVYLPGTTVSERYPIQKPYWDGYGMRSCRMWCLWYPLLLLLGPIVGAWFGGDGTALVIVACIAVFVLWLGCNGLFDRKASDGESRGFRTTESLETVEAAEEAVKAEEAAKAVNAVKAFKALNA